jgi:hypothetical protein
MMICDLSRQARDTHQKCLKKHLVYGFFTGDDALALPTKLERYGNAFYAHISIHGYINGNIENDHFLPRQALDTRKKC